MNHPTVNNRTNYRLSATMVLIIICFDVLVSLTTHLPAKHILELDAYAAAGAGLTGIIAACFLPILRNRSLASQATMASLVPVAAMGLGAVLAARAMFITSGDLHALAVIIAAAGTVGVFEALMFGKRIAKAGKALQMAARQLGTPSGDNDRTQDLEALSTTSSLNSGSELQALAAELESTSARLRESREKAEALEKSRKDLIVWISHDLRTPLTGLKAMIEALEDGVVTDKDTINRYYQNLKREVEQLAQMVSDLFELSTIQAGLVNTDRQVCSMYTVIEDAVSGASTNAANKEIAITIDHHEVSPELMISIHRPSIIRALRNLLSNAIRQTPAGCKITVEMTKEGDQACILVRDQCGGIPEDDMPHIFEPGYRGNKARTPGEEGAGLGLAITRGLLKAHDGTVEVSNMHGGCCFKVTLPLASNQKLDVEEDDRNFNDAMLYGS